VLSAITAALAVGMVVGGPVAGGPGTTQALDAAGEQGSGSAQLEASADSGTASGPGSGAGSGAGSGPAMTVLPGRTLEREPEPAPVPESASGTFAIAEVSGSSGTRPDDAGLRLTSYRVEVEEGLPFDTGAVAEEVEAILSDERGWVTRGHLLVREAGDADLRILLASPTTADRLCAPLLTRGRLSCRNGQNVVLNAWRWQNGAETYGEDLEGYRQYLVNHETGHALGYGHLGCPEAGAPAPVMVQQTKTLLGCAPNPWPSLER
jgi:hypothetical protein